ncbi:MAG: PAS domain S-box protein [Pseudomonadota bacterium]
MNPKQSVASHDDESRSRAIDSRLRSRLLVAFGSALAILLLLLLALTYWVLLAAGRSEASVRHTWAVLDKLQDSSFDMLAIESGARGFVLTGKESYLDAFRAARLREAQDQSTIGQLTTDNPTQQRRIVELARHAAAKTEWAEHIVVLRRTEGLDAAVQALRSGPGEQLMNEFQASIHQLRDEERQLLASRGATAKRRAEQAKTALVFGSVAAALALAVVAWLLQRSGSRRALVEKALRDSEAQYRKLVGDVQDYGVVTFDPLGNITSWNPGAEKIAGAPASYALGQNFSQFFPAEDRERGRPEEILRLAAENGVYEDQGMRVRKNGARFLVRTTFTASRDSAGVLRGFSVVSRDLSESSESGAKYRGLLEAAPDAMVVVDQAGGIVLLNLQAEKQFGYPRDELVGKQVTNIIPEGFAERLIADGTRTAAEALAQQIGTGIELVARRKDGSEFPIELMLSPLQSSEGILVTAAIRDISVRRTAEVHLAQMESRYRGLLEAAPDAMVVVNPAGEIVLLNVQAEKQFGYRRDELLGQLVKSIIPEGFAERLIADALRSTEDALGQRIGTGIELTGRRKDGSEFPIELMLSPLESDNGILVTTAIRDITKRKDAEAQLIQKVDELYRSNEELGQFAYVASHDLQEPLRMVASYTQLLSRRYKGKLDSDADEFIAFAVDGANRMQRLIQDLLTYSRVGTKGQQLLDSSSEGALEQAVRNLRGAITESGALVTHDPLPTVMADETQLVQLFQNLVGNAIKYQNPGVPHVHVSALKSPGKKWQFSVKDNGLGIDEQYFERIFGMFQRLHKREEFAGTGIGLAICKKIVERHGGSISVESQLGHGSTFHFDLTER